jgi:L-erythro-3,5-diaminohexanoate dehydrogenase
VSLNGFASVAASLGLDRVLEPVGFLPQAAWRLDADPRCRDNEVTLSVERLVLDAASARQLVAEHGIDGVPEAVLDIVRRRGKMHNPVTGSGGMAYGLVADVGRQHPRRRDLKPGLRVATLCSLSLTPLSLDEVAGFDPATHQVAVRGSAVLPSSASLTAVPDDLPLDVVLAGLDVAGAPYHVTRLAGIAGSVLILGAGSAGLLSLAAARTAIAPRGRIVVVDASQAACETAASLGFADAVICADAGDAVGMARAVYTEFSKGADLTVVVVDAPGCEAAAYLSTRRTGTILFFSMATSFTAAALGAEGISSDVRMIIGNGFSPDRGALTLDLLRRTPNLLEAFRRHANAEVSSQ